MRHAREDYNRIQDPESLIPSDEPVFLLRGQDLAAPSTVRYYAMAAMAAGAADDLVLASMKWATTMEDWQRTRARKTPDLAPVGRPPWLGKPAWHEPQPETPAPPHPVPIGSRWRFIPGGWHATVTTYATITETTVMQPGRYVGYQTAAFGELCFIAVDEFLNGDFERLDERIYRRVILDKRPAVADKLAMQNRSLVSNLERWPHVEVKRL